MHDDNKRDLLGFKPKVIHEVYNLSDFPVEILSVDKIFRECDIAQGIIFRGKLSNNIHDFTIDVEPGYKYSEQFRGGVQWHMMESKDNISSI